jgi:hypothetical protein
VIPAVALIQVPRSSYCSLSPVIFFASQCLTSVGQSSVLNLTFSCHVLSQTVYIVAAQWLSPETYPVSQSPNALSLYIHASTYSSILLTYLDPSKWDLHTIMKLQ